MRAFVVLFLLFVSSLGAAVEKPLEWSLFTDPSARTHVNVSSKSPGSLELMASAQSGDAIFVFGGQSERGFYNSLYAWGTDSNGNLGWKYLQGNLSANGIGHFGTLRAVSPANYPSGRSGACMDFITSSHLLLFGGRGFDAHGDEGFLNDLWVSEDLAQWGWFGGSNIRNRPSITSGPETTPSGRWKHTCAAHFETKKFIVFGGMGEHPLNPHETALLDDVYLYGEHGWEFLSGGQHSRVPDYSNRNESLRHPGSRAQHSSVLVENLFYTFGGQTLAQVGATDFIEVMAADLWSFDVNRRVWSFVTGSSRPNDVGRYPSAIGVPSSLIGPGARVQAAVTYNILTNEIYVFGGFGHGYVPDVTGHLNDLWSYDTFNKVWTWLGGSSSADPKPNLVQVVPAPRAGALLFSGYDGLEQDLTLIGGVGIEDKDKAAVYSEVWMINVNIPANFSRPAPETTLPPSTKHTTEETRTTEEPETTTKHPTSTSRSTTTDEPEEKTTTKVAVATTQKTTLKSTTTTTKATTTTTKKPVPTTTTKKPVPTTKPPATFQHFTPKPTTTSEDEITEPVREGTTSSQHQLLTNTDTHPSLFEAGSPQKIAALVLGSFIAIVLLVGGIVFLGFAFVANASQAGSRTVIEPYTAV